MTKAVSRTDRGSHARARTLNFKSELDCFLPPTALPHGANHEVCSAHVAHAHGATSDAVISNAAPGVFDEDLDGELYFTISGASDPM